jgi:hypothetical protein
MRTVPAGALKLSSRRTGNNGTDRDGYLIDIGQRAARAGVAAVIGRHRQHIGAEEIVQPGIDNVVRRRERGVDVRDRAGERHHGGAASGDRRPAGRGDRQGAVSSREHRGDRARAGISVADRQPDDRQRRVGVERLRARHTVFIGASLTAVSMA